jgi:tetratricopeptide (TPR) repeat protein
MSVEVQSRREALAARYNLPAQPEWQQFLNHFDLSENFALVVLLVTDADGADLCRMELEKHLQKEGRKLVALDVPTPDALRNLPSQLLATQPPADTGALWIAAVEPDYSQNFLAWKDAWQFALARLNPRRNEIRRQFNCSLIFVGAPWLQETMREIAPDLWSVRTLVARIEPHSVPENKDDIAEMSAFEGGETKGNSDPYFALQEAEKLRGVPGKELALARLLHRAGEGFSARDDWPAAEKSFTKALELKQQAGVPSESLLTTLLKLSETCEVLGQARRSLDYAQSALTLARQTKDKSSEAESLGALGFACFDLGDARRAVEFHEQAIVITREIGDRRREAKALGGLGIASAALGNTPKAIECFEQALAINCEIGDRRGEANALGNLGIAYKSLGDARKAIEFYEHAVAIDRQIGNRRGEGNALMNTGNAYSILGDTGKAIEFHEQSLAIWRSIGDRQGEGAALGNLGNAYAKLGDARKATAFYEQQLAITRDIGDRRGEGSALWNLAVALNKLGDRMRAIAHAETAIKIFESIEDPFVAKVRAKLGEWRGQK